MGAADFEPATSRVSGENSLATRPSVYSSDQTLTLSREGQPDAVMCLLGPS
jgi:hypothetical protein